MNTGYRLTACVACVAGMLAMGAGAITIDSSQAFAMVGPGDPTSPAQDTAELNDILANYYPTGAGTYTVSTTPSWGNSGSTPYTITIYDIGTLPGSATYATGGGASGTSFTLNLTSPYDFLMVKWANVDVFYDISGLTGTLDIQNDLVENKNGNAQGASGYKLFNDPPPVPDGGATVLLLGAALIGIGVARRKMSRV